MAPRWAMVILVSCIAHTAYMARARHDTCASRMHREPLLANRKHGPDGATCHCIDALDCPTMPKRAINIKPDLCVAIAHCVLIHILFCNTSNQTSGLQDQLGLLPVWQFQLGYPGCSRGASSLVVRPHQRLPASLLTAL